MLNDVFLKKISKILGIYLADTDFSSGNHR